MTDVEKKRQALQDELDSHKPHTERNMMGQFATPYNLAVDIMKHAHKFCHTGKTSFLEPAMGTGVFFSAFTEVFNNNDVILTKTPAGEGKFHYTVENNRDILIFFTIVQINDDKSVEFCFRTNDNGKEAPVLAIMPGTSVTLDFATFADNGNKSILLASPYEFATNDVCKLFDNNTDPASLNSKNIEITFYVIK